MLNTQFVQTVDIKNFFAGIRTFSVFAVLDNIYIPYRIMFALQHSYHLTSENTIWMNKLSKSTLQ